MNDVFCKWDSEIIHQNYVAKDFCDSRCNRQFMYFNDRLYGINAPKSMQPKFSSDEMKEYIKYCLKMLDLNEPAIFYNQFAKRLRTNPLPDEIKYFMKNNIPLPRPKTASELIRVQVIKN